MIPDSIWIMFVAALPIVELRGAIPLAMTTFHMSALSAFIYSVIGNILPIAILFLLFPPILSFFENHIPILHRLIDHHLAKLEIRHKKTYQKFGLIFLFVFTTIPFPGFGVWTAVPLSIVFKIKKRYAIPVVFFGMILSGIIVLLISQGSISLFKKI